MNSKLMKTEGLRAKTLSLAIAAAAAAMAGGDAAAEGWQWSATPYIWATDVGFDLAVADHELVDTEIAFGDLVDKLDGAALVRIEGMRGRQGVSFDLFNVELVDGGDFALPGAPGASMALDASIGLTIFDAAGIYDLRNGDQGFTLLYGTRVIEDRNELTTSFSLDGVALGSRSFDSSDTLVDGLVGFRFSRNLSRNFSYEFAADVSTGDTEMTWSAGPSVAYTFGENGRYEVTGGYRRMDVDFETAEQIDSVMSMSGLVIGFGIEF